MSARRSICESVYITPVVLKVVLTDFFALLLNHWGHLFLLRVSTSLNRNYRKNGMLLAESKQKWWTLQHFQQNINRMEDLCIHIICKTLLIPVKRVLYIEAFYAYHRRHSTSTNQTTFIWGIRPVLTQILEFFNRNYRKMECC